MSEYDVIIALYVIESIIIFSVLIFLVFYPIYWIASVLIFAMLVTPPMFAIFALFHYNPKNKTITDRYEDYTNYLWKKYE